MSEQAACATLGVDGGQSGIRVRSSVDSRTIEVHGVSHQEGDAIALVAEAVEQAYGSGAFGPVARVVLGLTTIPATAPERDRLCALVAEATGAGDILLMDDTVTAHAGALSLGWGASLIAGTGVASLAMSRDLRESFVLDGHGYLLGDDGGAFWIGRAGLRAVLRAADGRGPETALTSPAVHRYGELAGMHVRIQTGQRPVNSIAHFTPDVFAAANESDEAASAIVDAAAEQLAATASAAVRRILIGETPVPLGLGGRILSPGTILRERLLARLNEHSVPAAVRAADGTSLDGALAVGDAINTAGIPPGYARLIHAWKDEQR